MKTAIIAAKLVPPSDGEVLPLPRLETSLATALSRPVTFVVSGAGYGKTTSVAQFLRSRSARFLWLTLDALDQDEERLADYLLEGLRRITGIEAWPSSERAGSPGPEALGDLLIHDIQERVLGDTVVVFDEIDQLGRESGRSHRFLSRLITFLPQSVHLWALGRREPPLSVTKLRAAGSVQMIDEDSMRWGAPEVAGFAHRLGFELSEERADAVAHATGGRAATIRLVLENIPRGKFEEKLDEVLLKPTLEIRKYVEDEILQPLSAEHSELLMQLAVPEEVDLAIIEQALGDGELDLQIEELQRETNLLRPAAAAGVFRIDPLVRGVLLRIARTRLGTRRVQELQKLTGLLYLRQQEHARGITMLVEAGESQLAVTALSDVASDMLRDGRTSILRELCATLPEPEIRKDPQLVHSHARALLVEGRFAEADARYEELLRSRTLPGSLMAWAVQGRCEAAYRRGLLDDAQLHARRFEAVMEAAEPFCRAKMLNDLAILDLRTGRYEEAREQWEKALTLSFDPAVPAAFSRIILHNLGLPTAATGRIRASKSYFERLIASSTDVQSSQEAVAHLNLARIAVMQGNLTAAEQNLELTIQACERFNLESFRAEALEVYALVYRRRGEFDRAQLALDSAAAIYAKNGIDASLKELVDEQANVALARGHVEQAYSLITSLVDKRTASATHRTLAAPLLTLAEVELARGNQQAAVARAEEAAALARTWNMRYELANTLALLARIRDDAEGRDEAAVESARLASEEGYALGASGPVEAQIEVVDTRDDLSAQLFGPPIVRGDLGEASWPLKKALSVFCFLASSQGHSATKDQLIDTFWPEDDLEVVERNFHPTLSFLRRSLRSVTAAGKNFVQLASGRYRLDPRFSYSIDTDLFTNALAEGARAIRARKADAAVEQLTNATRIYRGTFMDGFYEPWVLGRRTSYNEELRRIVVEYGRLLLDEKRPDELLDVLPLALAADPYDESLAQLEMRAHAQRGDRSAIKASFVRLEDALEKELGEKPTPATRRLYEQLAAS